MHRRAITALALAGAALAVLSGCATPLPGARPAHGGSTFAPCHEKPEASTPSPDVATTEAIAMPEDEFWTLIDTLDASTDQKPYDALSARLAADGSVDRLVALDARMTLDLYRLDTACRLEWYDRHDPTGLGSVADDDFLYVRCDTIVAGRAVFERAATTTTLPWGRVDAAESDAESLLYVGVTAAEALGMSDDDFLDLEEKRIPISYETGSNPQGWPKAEDDGTLNRTDDGARATRIRPRLG